MITKPTCVALLESVREALRSQVTPAVSDPSVLGTLGMVDAVLDHVAARCGREIEAMRTEIGEIEVLAATVLGTGADTDGRIRAALDRLDERRSSSLDVTDLQREYDAASSVLARCIEVAIPAGGELRRSVEQVLDGRLVRETEHQAAFVLQGRA